MRKAVYPGTFDPLTIGHLDIIDRAVAFIDKLYICVADNYTKNPTFTTKERIKMIKRATSHLDNIIVTSTNDLIIRYAQDNNINIIIRGLRNITDYENEYALFQFNRNLNDNIETIILFPSSRNHFVSSSAIKELIVHDADISPYVPKEIINEVKAKLQSNKVD